MTAPVVPGAASDVAPDLTLVPARPLIEAPGRCRLPISGRATVSLVDAGASVVVGAPIAERLRDRRLEDKVVAEPRRAPPGRPLARAARGS